ncbi:MAG: hypothetical protein HOQ02_04300 [Lysobacter sp.]|nr:hypothetical protein [Lysobacter sp.]
MNELFKGLLFLHGYINIADLADQHERQRFGAGTAADAFARPLGNGAASRKWFGSVARDPHTVACPGP